MNNKTIIIDQHCIGDDSPCFIIAEMSANHNGSRQQAFEILHAAAEAGADAIKTQTYTPDTLTIKSDNPEFKIKGGLWDGRTLYDLYAEAAMPWEWQPDLKTEAEKLGMTFLSTAYDVSSVDFLEEIGVCAHKVASFELVDIPLLKYIAAKQRPVILSTGMSNLEEIEDAVGVFREAGNPDLILLKCVSAYPAPPEDMNLRTISRMRELFNLPTGLSDHTLGAEAAIVAVSLGAIIIEKHLTLSRADGGPDAAFSMEVDEFAALVRSVRIAEKALGKAIFEPTEKEKQNKSFRRSLFVVKDVNKGEVITGDNVRAIRPGYGMPPKRLSELSAYVFSQDLKAGTPLADALVEKSK